MWPVLESGAAAMLTPTEGAGTTVDTDVPPICGAIRWSHPSLAEIAGAGLSSHVIFSFPWRF